MLKNKIFFIISIFIIALIFLYPIFLGKFYSYRDVFLYVIPLKYFTILQIKNGIIPWYNPYNGGGEYFLLNPQTGLFYPLTYLFFLPPDIAFQIYQFIQIILCFFGAFFLAKSYKRDEKISLGLSLSVIFSGLFLSLWDLPFEMGSISFLFLSLWALKEKKFKLFLLFLSLLFFSGEPYIFLLSFLFLIYFCFIEKINLSFLFKPTLIFLIFSLGIILLILFLFPHTTRFESKDLSYEGFRFKEFFLILTGSSSFTSFVGKFGEKQHYLPVPYFGTFLFFFFLQGIFKKGRALYYLFAFFFFLILSMGTGGPFKFFYSFPPFSFIRYLERFLPLTLVPIFLISLNFDKKKYYPVFIHFLFFLISYSLSLPDNLINFIPFFILILLSLLPFSKVLSLLPFLEILVAFPIFTLQEFKLPNLPFDLKLNELKRICPPQKDLNFLRFLYPNNYFTKESDLKGAIALEGYTNLYYPLQISYTPSPLSLKIYNDSLKDIDFYRSCNRFGIIEKDEIRWNKIDSLPLIEPEPVFFKFLGDGFLLNFNLKEAQNVIVRFLKLPYTKVYEGKKLIKIEEKEKWILFKLKKGENKILIKFTPLPLKILYLLSLFAWSCFLCYSIIEWIISLF